MKSGALSEFFCHIQHFFRRSESTYPLARKDYSGFWNVQLSNFFITYLFLFTTRPVRTIINLTGGGILYANDS